MERVLIDLWRIDHEYPTAIRGMVGKPVALDVYPYDALEFHLDHRSAQLLNTEMILITESELITDCPAWTAQQRQKPKQLSLWDIAA